MGGRGRRTRSLRSFAATQSALGQFGEHGVDEGEVALMDVLMGHMNVDLEQK